MERKDRMKRKEEKKAQKVCKGVDRGPFGGGKAIFIEDTSSSDSEGSDFRDALETSLAAQLLELLPSEKAFLLDTPRGRSLGRETVALTARTLLPTGARRGKGLAKRKVKAKGGRNQNKAQAKKAVVPAAAEE